MSSSEPNEGSAAPETWVPARRAIERMLRPLERFLHVEAASGVVLLVAAVVAFVWANSPARDTYERFWHAPVTVTVGSFTSATTVHFWINDGLMVVFFFVVGLEIRREIHEGELSDRRRAALPAVAALGGMLVPAVLFHALNHGLPSQRGWGVPMATDIAFAVGVLALLGKRVPAALRVLLLALAIIDDIGAILVIAVFYSSGISASGLLLASGAVASVLVLQRLGVRAVAAYLLPGAVLWVGCLRAGVHPTVAGVILGLLTPAKAWFGEQGVAPVVRLQTALHPWVAFVVMPIFALANSGVSLGNVAWDPAMQPAILGVGLGLIVGKPLGIVTMSLLAIRLRVAGAPAGVTWRGLAVVGSVAGIGFTMAMFIAELAFARSPFLAGAKVAVLAASVVSGLLSVTVGRLLLASTVDPRAAATPSEAEASAER